VADNVTINASSGTANVASDDVGGVQFQNVKIDIGGNGLSVPLSSSNPLPVTTSTVNTSITNGRTVTVSANVAVALASSTVVKEVIITAETDNTGIVVVGGSGVVSTLATRTGVPLNAGDSVSFQITNLNAINIAAVVATDGVTYVALS
jgi:hypothetical protein